MCNVHILHLVRLRLCGGRYFRQAKCYVSPSCYSQLCYVQRSKSIILETDISRVRSDGWYIGIELEDKIARAVESVAALG